MSIHPSSTPHTTGYARKLLADNIVRLRALRGYSQEALAHEAGLHRTFVAHVERRARNASVDNIEKIAVALGVGVRDLFSEK